MNDDIARRRLTVLILHCVYSSSIHFALMNCGSTIVFGITFLLAFVANLQGMNFSGIEILRNKVKP